MEELGIVEGKPFLLSTGQILYEDDGARVISPADTPTFSAKAIMKLGGDREIETLIAGETLPRNERTFSSMYPSLSWYDS